MVMPLEHPKVKWNDSSRVGYELHAEKPHDLPNKRHVPYRPADVTEPKIKFNQHTMPYYHGDPPENYMLDDPFAQGSTTRREFVHHGSTAYSFRNSLEPTVKFNENKHIQFKKGRVAQIEPLDTAQNYTDEARLERERKVREWNDDQDRMFQERKRMREQQIYQGQPQYGTRMQAQQW